MVFLLTIKTINTTLPDSVWHITRLPIDASNNKDILLELSRLMHMTHI